MRSVAIVDESDRARPLVGALSEYDATPVEPPARALPAGHDVVVVDWDQPVVDRVTVRRDTRSWAVVAVVDAVQGADPVGDGADGLVVRPIDADRLREVIDRVALQRAYIGTVRDATDEEPAEGWHAAADDLLDALTDDLSHSELFRRLL